MHNVITLFTIATLSCVVNQGYAQNNHIMSSNISSLQVTAGNNWLSMPVIEINGEDAINIAFDDFTHELHRYAYRLEHCEANWQPSTEIFESDYCEGFADGNTIEQEEQSINTNTIYTHYSLSIPNENCKIKLSGNYKLYIYDENEGDTILSACFMVVEPLMKIGLSVTSNTDIDINECHQQLAMNLNYGSIKVSNPEREIHTVLLQNGRWETARRDIQPQYITYDGMRWEHNKSLIFDGGNEYHKFEILSTDHPTLGIESTYWDGKSYHAKIWTDLPRPNYTYDEDTNGAFYIRNSDNRENNRISEYVDVEFRLKAPLQNAKVYVNGVWTNGAFTPQYEMTYNNISQQYETTIKLKQGYYSYQYLCVSDNGEIKPVTTEGNFYQTENEYQAFVYWRGLSHRTDQLVGYATIKYK